MSDRETRDFMSVDSFSQLPFIRPAPTRERPLSSTSGGAIRLFGIEFPHESGTATAEEDSSTKDDPAKITASSSTTNTAATAAGEESGRKFECHYCCRHFPTSQALGGHQNAHKRERQRAKRAHLQSAMAAAATQHHQSSDGHTVYGLFNYHHRLGSAAPPTTRFAFDSAPAPYYPSWQASNSLGSSINGPRFYGGLGSLSQPINGSPLPGLWRVPGVVPGAASLHSIHGDRTMPLPLLRGSDELRLPAAGGSVARSGNNIGSSSSSSSPSPSSAVQENVSLDLHL